MEKIKVNLSYITYSTIINDAEAFQIIKANGEINKNEIFNRIVANLATNEFNNKITKKNKYKELLSLYINDSKELNEIINNIELIESNSKIKRSEVYDQIVMIRPTKIYEDIFNNIIYNYLDNSSMSSYFRNLFDYYASLNQDERERIVFKSQLESINIAIKNGITIKTKMMNNIVDFHIYKVVTTKEKLYNYVLGVIQTENDKRKTISMHLNKFDNVILSNKIIDLHKNEIKMLDNMIEKGPQYIAGEYLDAKIELTKAGKRRYRSIFINRPIAYKIEGDYYYFYSSRMQLFQYFSRFGKDAYVVSPSILQNDLLNYFKDGYENIVEKRKSINLMNNQRK